MPHGRRPARRVPGRGRLAAETGGHYLDQFTYAERATDWRGNNNIAESIFAQMAHERFPVPCWIVVGAGTGGTSATIGRYIRYRRHDTYWAVVDPENSAFLRGWRDDGDPCRPAAGLAHRGHRAPASGAELRRRRRRPDDRGPRCGLDSRRAGASSRSSAAGWARRPERTCAVRCASRRELRAAGQRGSIVTLLCDGGERYARTYFDDGWLQEQGIDLTPHSAELADLLGPPGDRP